MSGFFGCVSKRDCVADVFYGTDYHSHLGTKRAGMVFFHEGKFIRKIHSLANGYFRNKFEDELPKFKGAKVGMGIISDTESQPITVTSRTGRISVITIGRIDNKEELIDEMLNDGKHFSELSDSSINSTELIAILLSTAPTLVEGVKLVHEKVKGSCSFMVLSDKGVIYAVRDKLGRTPIILGKDNNGFVASFETTAYYNLGYEYLRDLGAGEMVSITADGVTTLIEPRCSMQVCSFLWVYYGYPSSSYEGINVDMSRYENGRLLAKRDGDLTNIDGVAGIPDSGIGHAIGYSNGLQIPYMRPFVKYTPTWPRSFMPQNQDMRDVIAKMKLLPNSSLINGKKIVFLDDSIVRGTQLKDNVVKLYESGAKEVHVRVACPPLVYPCSYLNFSSSRSSFDLYTRRVIAQLENTMDITDEILAKYSNESGENYERMVEEMRKGLNLSSLKFQYLNDLVAAIGLPKEKICTHCFDNSSRF